MISYNGIVFVGYDEEEWKPINYKNIVKGKYEVSNYGRFRKKKNGKMLYGNNPKNEKGYRRIALKTISGKIKKFPMHRIVLHTFGYLDETKEVNHKDKDKNNNSIWNLENSTRKENAEHAAKNDLYQSCERHYRSTFTNDEVHKICQYVEEGLPVSDIIKILGLSKRKNIYSNIDKILNGKSWTKISSKYNINYNVYHYKTYKYEDLCIMCDCIFNKQLKNKEIIKMFPQYNAKKLNTALKSMRAGRVYKKIVNKYKSSTTRERQS